MKKFIYNLIIAASIINFSSCSDFLELPSKSTADSESVFSTIDKAEMAVLACYTGVWMEDAWYKAQNGTDEMWSTESNSNSKNYAANYVINDGSCPTGVYTNSYLSIERCNSCIKGLENMSLSEDDAKKRDIYLGECLAVRATCFLNLIRYFGDVPYPTVPVLEMSTFSSSRVSRDDIYDGIIADLQEAINLLPWYSEGFFSTPERISKNAAYGLLARTALYAAGYSLRWNLETYDASSLSMSRRSDESRVRELYTIADNACKTLVDKGENNLLANYEDVFRALNEGGTYNPSEVMFEYAQYGNTTNGRIGYTNGLCIHASNSLYGKTLPLQLIHPTFYLSFDSNDTRRDVTVGNYSIDESGNDIAVPYGALNIGKWRCNWKKGSRTGTTLTDVNWPMLRYSDVLLMYAEAENYLNNGPTAAAKAAYEKVRTRAFGGNSSLIGTTPTTYDGFFNAIVKERAFELATEGWRRTDLIRWNLLDETLTATKSNTEKMSKREAPYDEVKSYRAYMESKSLSWKDPLVALTYVDFDHKPTAEELAQLGTEYGGTWNWVDMFNTPNVAGVTNKGIAGQAKIMGYKENNNTLPAWISELYRGYSKGHVELYTLSSTDIIDVNPGLTGQQLPGY
jgi:hypothetical protein